MTLPNFVIIGTPKSGTTTLFRYLARHPDVFMPAKKELDFFNRHHGRGRAWYEAQFSGRSDERAVGEGSVLYSIDCLWPETPARMGELLPDCRLIYLVRHPLERIESLWCQHLMNGDKVPDFPVAVREWRPLLAGSLYWQQLGRFREHYPDDRIHIMFFEDIVTAPVDAMARCFEFLGIDAAAVVEQSSEHVNPRQRMKVDRPIWARLRHTPLGLAARRRLPESVKDGFRRMLRKRLDAVARWDEPTIEWAVRAVEPDAHRFLEHVGKPASHWDLGATWVQRALERTAGAAAGPRTPFVLAALDFYEGE